MLAFPKRTLGLTSRRNVISAHSDIAVARVMSCLAGMEYTAAITQNLGVRLAQKVTNLPLIEALKK